MKYLWFFLMLICIASCRHRHKDVVDKQEDLSYPQNQKFNHEFLDEQWQDLDAKESDESPELNKTLFANFNSSENKILESQNNNENPEYDYYYGVDEEIDRNDSSLFLSEDDELSLFKESPSLNSEGENSDKSSEEYINYDWLYKFYSFENKLKKQMEEDIIKDKYVNMDKLQLPDFKFNEKNNDKFFDKLSEEEEDVDSSRSNKDEMLPFFKFDHENKMPIEENENDDLLLFLLENDYDYQDHLSQEEKDEDSINKDADNKLVLLSNNEKEINFIILNIKDPDDVDKVQSKPSVIKTIFIVFSCVILGVVICVVCLRCRDD